jgi:signal transduction histidine kinase
LIKLRQLVRGALAEMRALLFELRPSALESADLETLLPQLADAFSGRTRIPVAVVLNGRQQLPTDVKIAIYRITQEALNNIAKHAEATEVALKLTQETGSVQLTIHDNGCGFNKENTAPEQMGIAIMQERAEAIHAQLNLNSQHEAGTQLQLNWQANNGESE